MGESGEGVGDDGQLRGFEAAGEGAPALRVVRSPPTIAFVGTFPPRRCGIATFTHDLSRAMVDAGQPFDSIGIALTEPGGAYEYPPEVRYEIRQSVKGDYARAAEFVNYGDVRLVCVQHEHGIFGGEDGAFILDFVSGLRIPVMATLHTVLAEPSSSQRQIVSRLAARCGRLVVMSQVAADLLVSAYGVDRARVQVIPHGIPEMPNGDARAQKTRFGLSDQRMLLTFGLLGPNKGIETVIRALPRVVARFPDVKYFVVGRTHPNVARTHGEAYRTMLEREAVRLGVREHVVFRDQFVAIDELCRYLQAADVFISPYHAEAQVSSGALSYAMGAGAAAISTPYWHARELLNDRRGKLFPFGDSDALAAVLTEVLGDPQELQRLRQEAYAHTRPMLWSRVGQQYVALGADLLREERRPAPRAAPLAASTLPELRLDHLRRMTDDTGVIQHATFTVPCRPSGYCVDDNARALVVALRASRLEVDGDAQALVTTYLSFLHACQRDSGDFDNLTSYARVVQRGSHSEDCLGRAMWALGATVALAEREGERKLAREMFLRALPRTIGLGPRGTALTLLGFTAWLAVDDTAVVRTALRARADNLVARFDAESSAAWRWFEPQLTYDNAMLPLALFGAHAATADERYLRIARESLDFLESTCFEGERLVVVGNLGWHARGAQKARADEQAIDASAFVLAFRAAFAATGEPRYLQRMHQSFSWFLGSNRLETPVYDFITAGCRDGLGASEVNRNQGAESTICFLTALLEVMDVADEGPPLRRDRATKGSN